MSMANVSILDVVSSPGSGNNKNSWCVWKGEGDLGIQEVTDNVRVLQETLLPLVHHLQEVVYLHYNVEQELWFFSHHSVKDGSQQLEDVEQLSFVTDYTPYLKLEPPVDVAAGKLFTIPLNNTHCGRASKSPRLPCNQKECISERRQEGGLPPTSDRLTLFSGPRVSSTFRTLS